MSTFDVGVGASQDLLNSISNAVYLAVYPKVFTGSQSVSEFQLNVAWDIKTAPVFNLATSNTNSIRKARADLPATDGKAGDGSTATFEMVLPQVALTLSGPDMPNAQAVVQVTIQCRIEIDSSNRFSFIPFQAAASGNETPPSLWLLNNVAMPFVLNAITAYVSGLQLPPLELAGVSLGTPVVVVQDSHVIAFANVQGAGTPTPPEAGTNWPPTEFFVLLNHWALQAAASVGMSNFDNAFSDSGGGHSGPASYSWNYSMTLENPTVARLDGPNINISLQLGGSVGASAGIWGANIGIDLDASSTPDPSGVAQLSIDTNNDLIVTIESVNEFTIVVSPSGSVSDWVPSAVVSLIADAIISSLTPVVTNFIRNISFKVWNIATFNITEAGYTFNIAPSGMSVVPFQDLIAATGSLNFTRATVESREGH